MFKKSEPMCCCFRQIAKELEDQQNLGIRELEFVPKFRMFEWTSFSNKKKKEHLASE